MTVRRFSIDGGSLAFRDVGGGDPVVLVHGISGSMRNWARVAPKLADMFRVLSYDQRGHGRSDPIPGGCSLDVLAADLSHLLDHAGVERAAIVAHSMGSMVAQHFVLSNPGRVSRLVLIGSTAAPLTYQERHYLAGGIDAARRAGIEGAWESHQELLTTEQRRRMAADPGLFALAREEFVATSADGYIALATSGLDRVDLRPRLGEIGCPVLVVVGEHDEARLSTTAEIAALVPHATRVVIEGATHSPMLEAPEQFLGPVIRFLGGR